MGRVLHVPHRARCRGGPNARDCRAGRRRGNLAHDYGDVTAVGIEHGARFLDVLSGGRQALYAAKAEGRDNYDLADDEIGAVDQMRTGDRLVPVDRPRRRVPPDLR